MAEQRYKIGALPTRDITHYTTTSYLSVTFRQLEVVNIGNNVYQSLVDNNVGNALTDESKWVCLVNNDSYIEAESARQESFAESQAARTEAFNEAEAGRTQTFNENETERQAAIDAKLAEINAMEFDDQPEPGSNKAVKSGGLWIKFNQLFYLERNITLQPSMWSHVTWDGEKYATASSSSRYSALVPYIKNQKVLMFKANYEVAVHQLAGIGNITALANGTTPTNIKDSGYLAANTEYTITLESWTERIAFQCKVSSSQEATAFNYIKIYEDRNIASIDEDIENLTEQVDNIDEEMSSILLYDGTDTDITSMITESNSANTTFQSNSTYATNNNRLSVMLDVPFANVNGTIRLKWSDTTFQIAIQQVRVTDLSATNPYNGMAAIMVSNSGYLDAGDYTRPINVNANRLILQTTLTSFSDLMNAIETLEVTVRTDDVPDNNKYIGGLLDTIAVAPSTTAYPYTGTKPNFVVPKNQIYLQDKFKLYNSSYGVQGAALYGDYLFQFSAYGLCEIYDFVEGTHLAEVSLPSHSSSYDHNDTASFGNQRVSYDDEFPVVYVSGTQISTTAQTPYIKVYRITRPDDVWTFELVQKIMLPSVDIIGTFPDAVIDNTTGNMWVMGWDTAVTGENRKCLFTCFRVPLITEGQVSSGVLTTTIDISAKITQVIVTNMKPVQQGLMFYNGQIFVPYGAKSSGYQGLDVVDLQQQRVVTHVDLYNTPITEPEAVVLWNGELYIISQKNDYVRKIMFY